MIRQTASSGQTDESIFARYVALLRNHRATIVMPQVFCLRISDPPQLPITQENVTRSLPNSIMCQGRVLLIAKLPIICIINQCIRESEGGSIRNPAC